MDFGWGSAPDPTGELTALPRPPSWDKGALLLREREGKGKREEREEKGREGEVRGGREGCRKQEENGKGREGRKGKKAGERGKGETRHTNPNLLPAPLPVVG